MGRNDAKMDYETIYNLYGILIQRRAPFLSTPIPGIKVKMHRKREPKTIKGSILRSFFISITAKKIIKRSPTNELTSCL